LIWWYVSRLRDRLPTDQLERKDRQSAQGV
jgi:hypothetical protein